MTPIEKFLEWFNLQDIPTRDTVAFEVLYMAPDFDLAQQKGLTNTAEIFKQYLSKENTAAKIVGKLLYVKSAIDFNVTKFDSIDDLIDSQNMHQNIIQKGETEGKDMDFLKKLHSEGSDRYALRKSFKENWTVFCDEYLNFEKLDNYMLEDFLKRPK